MKEIIGLLIFCVSGMALGCAGSGITKLEMISLMDGIEEKVKVEKQLDGLRLVNIIWSDLETQRGLEGDCDATALEAKLLIITKDKKNKYCMLDSEVKLVKSPYFGEHFNGEIIKKESCSN